jgi:hypothetical protein
MEWIETGVEKKRNIRVLIFSHYSISPLLQCSDVSALMNIYVPWKGGRP